MECKNVNKSRTSVNENKDANAKWGWYIIGMVTRAVMVHVDKTNLYFQNTEGYGLVVKALSVTE